LAATTKSSPAEAPAPKGRKRTHAQAAEEPATTKKVKSQANEPSTRSLQALSKNTFEQQAPNWKGKNLS
jgi:hypothetical protein